MVQYERTHRLQESGRNVIPIHIQRHLLAYVHVVPVAGFHDRDSHLIDHGPLPRGGFIDLHDRFPSRGAERTFSVAQDSR